MEQPQQEYKNSKRMIWAGIVTAQTLGWFAVAWVLLPFLDMSIYSHNVSLLFIGFIFLVTMVSATGAFFWAKAGMPMKIGRRLAVMNGLPFLFLLFANEEIRALPHVFFFAPMFLVFYLISAAMGNWFGVRFFYE